LVTTPTRAEVVPLLRVAGPEGSFGGCVSEAVCVVFMQFYRPL
jgi:hypothetical protein